MTQQNQNEAPKGVWVRLHLEAQSERSTMPPFIEGYLTKESAAAYSLTKVIKVEEDPDTFEMMEVEVHEHHHINRTYVWDCEVLGERPITNIHYNGEGGLG